MQKNWQEVADLGYESLLENETWDLVDLPKDRNAVGSRWVFKVKHHSDGRVEQYKCRLIAKGYTQLYGADYDETFWLYSYLTVLCCSKQSIRSPNGCCNCIPQWTPGRGNIHGATRGLHQTRARASGMQTEEINIWTKTVSSLLEQGFHGRHAGNWIQTAHQTPVCL